MSRQFLEASVQRLEYAGAPITSFPFTVAAWVYNHTRVSNHIVFGIRDDSVPSTTSDCLILYLSNVQFDLRVLLNDGIGGSDQIQTQPNGYSDNVWQHVCAVFANNTTRAAYINNLKTVGSGGVANLPAGLDVFRLGAGGQGGIVFPHDGLIAHAAAWSVALSDSEVAALQDAPPNTVQAGSLIGYWPLRDDDKDDADAFHLTPVNSPTFSPLDPFPLVRKQRAKGLPIPFLDHVPKIFRDNPSPDLVAFTDKMDALFGAWGEETKELQHLYNPARAPAAALAELGFMFQAGFKGYESEREKRQKIGFAVRGHKSRGLWEEDAKPKIDAIAGGDAKILRSFSGDDWILVGDGLTPAGFYWATLGADGIDDELGIALIGGGDEVEVVGNIYIDVDNDSLTAQQVENMVQELEADVVPAYIRVILGYVNVGGQFIEYARI